MNWRVRIWWRTCVVVVIDSWGIWKTVISERLLSTFALWKIFKIVPKRLIYFPWFHHVLIFWQSGSMLTNINCSGVHSRLHVIKLNFLRNFYLRKFLNRWCKLFRLQHYPFIFIDLIQLYDIFNSFDCINDGIHFLFIFGNKCSQCDFHIVELYCNESFHKVVHFVDFLGYFLLLGLKPWWDDLDFLF